MTVEVPSADATLGVPVWERPARAHVWTPRKVVFCSGASDPKSCALSPAQWDFLHKLPVADDEKVLANFPWLAEFESPRPPPPLWSASWHNASQFWQASRSRFRTHAVRHWNSLVRSCDELLIVTLSCGLEIVNGCLASEAAASAPCENESARRAGRLFVLALGPVAWERPRVPHRLIAGSRDIISYPFFRSPDLRLTGVGHLDYLTHPVVLDQASSQLFRTENS